MNTKQIIGDYEHVNKTLHIYVLFFGSEILSAKNDFSFWLKYIHGGVCMCKYTVLCVFIFLGGQIVFNYCEVVVSVFWSFEDIYILMLNIWEFLCVCM